MARLRVEFARNFPARIKVQVDGLRRVEILNLSNNVMFSSIQSTLTLKNTANSSCELSDDVTVTPFR